MDRAARAVELYDSGCNCAQSVLHAFMDETGLEPRQLLGIASAFGGGLAGTGNICGAMTGALMVIGLRYGQATPGDSESCARTKQEGQRFLCTMESRHKALTCRQLLGYDTSTPEGSAAAQAADVRKNVCRPLVAEAAVLLGELGENVIETS